MASILASFLVNVDKESADLMIQLQLADIEERFSRSKGKCREDEPSDADVAFQMYKADLDAVTSLSADRRMAQSIVYAVQSDGLVLREAFSEEERVAKDREMACNLAAGAPSEFLSPADHAPRDDEIDDELLAKMEAIYVMDVDDSLPFSHDTNDDVENWTLGEEAETSSWAETRARTQSTRDRRCVACHEIKRFFDVARVPCHHEYCRECLRELFELSLTDESLFPPRCCRQPIPIRLVRLFLESKLIHEYVEKKVEFETPNRTYCSSKSCSTFIRTENVANDIATCPACETMTCTVCKEASHHGDCPNDVALQQVLQVAHEAGWQRCHSCWRIVELEIGCNHMTYMLPLICDSRLLTGGRCRCGAQFCYVCGLRWKSCTCEQWDEHRLLARANQIVDRDLGLPGPAVEILYDDAAENDAPHQQPVAVVDDNIPDGAALLEPDPEGLDDNIVEGVASPHLQTPFLDPASNLRTALVAQVIENLRQNHECQHDRWNWVRGRHQCEECYHSLPQYIFECRQCSLRACNRCKRNRL